MIKNWRFVQPRLYDFDPPTIHHASLSCKLSRAVKFEALLGVLGIRDNWQNSIRDKG